MTSHAGEAQRFAPYPIELYDSLIRRLLARPEVDIPEFCIPESTLSPSKLRAFFRIDVDTLACIEKLPLLLQVCRRHRVNPAVSFRVDPESEYDLRDYKARIDEVVAMGAPLALHTVCYLCDEYAEELMRELQVFRERAGMAPSVVTIHGLGSVRQEVRAELVEGMDSLLGPLGLKFSDCHPRLRAYHHCAQDCHWDDSTKRRFIKSDYVEVPSEYQPGQSVVILAHPCYWVS